MLLAAVNNGPGQFRGFYSLSVTFLGDHRAEGMIAGHRAPMSCYTFYRFEPP